MSNQDPRDEDAVVERIVFAQLRGESVDVESELALLPESLAESIRRRLEVVARIRDLTSAAGELSGSEMRLGDFVLEEEIGRGGMGVVYRAFQRSLDRHVAVKVLSRVAATDDRRSQRFIREANSLARLQHPGIVPVLSAGESQGVLYFAMPIIAGASLASILGSISDQLPAERSMLSVRSVLAKAADDNQLDLPGSYVEFVVRIVAEAARALAHAHHHGVLHRDIKPGNLMVTPDGHVQLIDFGLVHLTEDDSRLTKSADVLGTLAYLAPEELDGDSSTPDVRSEIYSLGVVLYECLAGTWPLANVKTSGILDRIRNSTPAPLSVAHRGIPRDLETICHAAIERDPERRYSQMGEFADDLERFLRFEPIQASPPGAATRVWRHLRRRPRVAFGVMAAAMAGVLLLSFALLDRVRESNRVEEQCREYLAFCDTVRPKFELLIEDYNRLRTARSDAEARVQAGYVDESERQDLLRVRRTCDENRSRFAILSRQIEAEQIRVLRIVGDANEELTRAVRESSVALLEVEWRDAANRRDKSAVARCEMRYSSIDPGGRHAEGAQGRVVIEDQGAGGDAFLFRYFPAFEVKPDELSARLVPVPFGVEVNQIVLDGPSPGTYCLAVGGVGLTVGLFSGDLITSLDGMDVAPGYMVRSVVPGGLADTAGVRAWDRLVSIESEPIDSWAHLRIAVFSGADVLEVEFTRPGEELEVMVPNAHPKETVFETVVGIEIATAAEMLSSVSTPRPIALVVYRGGERLDLELSTNTRPGVRAVDTLYPLAVSNECRLDLAEGNLSLDLPAGEYLLVKRADERAESRYPFIVTQGETTVVGCQSCPAGRPGPDVVWVPDGVLDRPVDPNAPGAERYPPTPVEGFWIDRFELTVREWFEFASDPEVAEDAARVLAETGKVINLPRDTDSADSMKFKQPMSMSAAIRWISFEDVERYVAWRNRELVRDGLPWRVSLPTAIEWERAAGSSSYRPFTWGSEFDPRLTHFQYTWPKGVRMPVGSHPGDESVFGVRDMCGSSAEWLDSSWTKKTDRMQTTAGGAYGYAWRDAYRLQCLTGENPDEPIFSTTVRLVYRQNS